jgi:hypothetical protein
MNEWEKEIMFNLFQGKAEANQHRTNKHLARMYMKLFQYAYEKDTEKFNTLMKIMLIHSNGFAVMTIVKTFKDWKTRFDI